MTVVAGLLPWASSGLLHILLLPAVTALTTPPAATDAMQPKPTVWMTYSSARGLAAWQLPLADVPANETLVLNKVFVQLPRGLQSAACLLRAGDRSYYFQLARMTSIPVQVVAGPASVSLRCVGPSATRSGEARAEASGFRLISARR